MPRQPIPQAPAQTDSDAGLLALARDGQDAAARIFMQRHNRRLFRVAYAILKSRPDAEEVVQDVYVRALTGSAAHDGRASVAAWLTRIAANAAFDRRRTLQRRAGLLEKQGIATLPAQADERDEPVAPAASPEAELARRQISRRIETAIGRIPDSFRPVFMLREIEGLSIEDTAIALDIAPGTVKSRHARARRHLQDQLEAEWRDILQDAFPFAGARCAALADAVMARIHSLTEGKTR